LGGVPEISNIVNGSGSRPVMPDEVFGIPGSDMSLMA
jgi:hypothetical protein